MRRLRLLVDVDEVLGDFQTPALDIMAKVTGRRYRPEDFEVWDIFSVLTDEQKELVFAEIEKPGFCSNLKPLRGAVEAIRYLRSLVDIFPVTSPFHSVPWVTERNQWLGDHFGWKKSEIVHTSAKFLVRGDAILDDKPEHIVAWTAEYPAGLGMLWHIPNTRTLGHDHLRVRSWEEVIERVKSIVR